MQFTINDNVNLKLGNCGRMSVLEEENGKAEQETDSERKGWEM